MKIKRILLLAAIFGCTVTLQAQTDDPVIAELLENFFRDNEGASESDAQLFLEHLEQLRQKPLDMNRAGRDDLMALHLIHELKVEQFLQYRERLGPLLNIYELQAVPGWELDDIRRLQPFIVVGGGLDKRGVPLVQGIRKGTNEILLRSAFPDEPNFPNNSEGGPYGFALRYRHNFDNRLRFGFTAENDAGEAFFAKSNPRGFDFYSAHLFIQNTGGRVIKSVALGDFTARMGQGLLLQTGFSPGKSAESVNLVRGTRKLGAYSAFGESFFLRGAGVHLQLAKKWDLSVFGSYRLRDANVNLPTDTTDAANPDELFFTSLQTTGLHRTPREVENERAIRETLGGASLSWTNRYGQISANILHLQYNTPFTPTEAPYRYFNFRGDQLTGASVDYQLRYRNFLFFGENTMSDNGGKALLNGVLIGADRRTSIGVIYRNLEPEYQSVYGAPFAEVSGAANEQGLYTGLEIRPSKPWKINLYADLWRHPWLRFQVDAPSRGNDYLARVMWQPTRQFQTYLIFQTETKERNAPFPETGLQPNRRDRLRLHAGYKVSPAVDLRSRIEWMYFTEGKAPAARGFMAYQEAVIKPRNFPLSGALRYAVFDTESFDSRVFAFENDLFAAVSIPALYGRGNRFYCNLTWRIGKHFRLEGRYETTYLERAVSSGTVPGREQIIKLQVRVNW